MHTQKKGYILILVLVIISLSMMIATYIANKGIVFNSFTKAMIDREKAEQLALSGIQVALARLYVPEEKPEVKEGKKAPSPAQMQLNQTKKIMGSVLPNLGKWQNFKLKKDVDGMDGAIKICIVPEGGKINLNRLFDFNEGKFKPDAQKFLQDVFDEIKKQKGGDNLLQKVTTFLKKRGYPLNDVSELMTIDGFDVFKNSLWFDPDAKGDKKQPLFLYDIFTVYTPHMFLDPWSLSQSVAQLTMQAARSQDAKVVTELMKVLKQNHDWKVDWESGLKKMYEKEFSGLSKYFVPLLAPSFAPTTFSVLSVGTSGRATYKLYAIVERIKSRDMISMQVRNVYYVS